MRSVRKRRGRSASPLGLAYALVLACSAAAASAAEGAGPVGPGVDVLLGPGVASPADGGFDLLPGQHVAFASSRPCPCIYSFRFVPVPASDDVSVRVVGWSEYARLAEAGPASPGLAAAGAGGLEAPSGSLFAGPERVVVLVSRSGPTGAGAAALPSAEPAAVLFALQLYSGPAEDTLTVLSKEHALVQPLGSGPLRLALRLGAVPVAGHAPYDGAAARLRLIRASDAAKVHSGFPYEPLAEVAVPVPTPPDAPPLALAHAGAAALVLLAADGASGSLRVRLVLEPGVPGVDEVRGRPDPAAGGPVTLAGRGFGSAGPLGDHVRVRLGDDWCLDAHVVSDAEIACTAAPLRPGASPFFLDALVELEAADGSLRSSGDSGAFAFSYAADAAAAHYGGPPPLPYPPPPERLAGGSEGPGVAAIRRRALLAGAAGPDDPIYDQEAQLFVSVSLSDRAEAEAAAARLRAELEAIQFPPRESCAQRTILLYEFTEFYGLGAHFYWLGVALRVALERNWTLVVEPRPWLYWPYPGDCGGLECLFEPVSSCRAGEGRVAQHWRSHATALGGGAGSESQAFRNAVPPAYRALGLRWFKGQLLRFLLRPRPPLLEAAAALRARVGLREGEPCVAMHVRRAADKRVGGEIRALNEAVGPLWAPHLARWNLSAPLRVLADAARDAGEAAGASAVFVMADSDVAGELAALLDAGGRLHGLRLAYDSERSRTRQYLRGDTDALETLASLWTAASCPAFAGSLASCFGRLAADLAAARDHGAVAVSVDAPWYSHP